MLFTTFLSIFLAGVDFLFSSFRFFKRKIRFRRDVSIAVKEKRQRGDSVEVGNDCEELFKLHGEGDTSSEMTDKMKVR